MGDLRQPTAQIYLNFDITMITRAVKGPSICNLSSDKKISEHLGNLAMSVAYYHLRCNRYQSQRRCKVPNTACYNKIVQDREKYSPLVGLTCMRFLMWILRSFALISVYPD